MPKLKTHKGAKRRYGVTGSGKLMRMKRGSSHLRRKKSKAVLGSYDRTQQVSPTQVRRIKTLIPAYNK